MDKITSDDDLRMKLQVNDKYGGGQSVIDAIKARNVLHTELEYFSDSQTTYHLEERVRDRLIAHARQDAAHAVLGIGSLSSEVSKLRRDAKIVAVLLAGVIVLLVANLLK